jgi:hypothetical protein
MPVLIELSRCRHMIHQILGAFEHVDARFLTSDSSPLSQEPRKPQTDELATNPAGKRRFLDRV